MVHVNNKIVPFGYMKGEEIISHSATVNSLLHTFASNEVKKVC
jgi:hypothetical protein